MIKLTYLACPYRHTDPNVVKMRCRAALYVTAQHWMEFDLAILAACQRLLILKLDGWESSKGIEIERGFAQKMGIPIEEMDLPEEALFLPQELANLTGF